MEQSSQQFVDQDGDIVVPSEFVANFLNNSNASPSHTSTSENIDDIRSKTIANIQYSQNGSSLPQAYTLKNDAVLNYDENVNILQKPVEHNEKISDDLNNTGENIISAEIISKPENIAEKQIRSAIDSNGNKGDKSSKTDSSDVKGVKPKRIKKSIFISYSPDASFTERKFVVETVRQLKENNLAEDIWFDKDEKTTDSPCWFSSRMEAVEKCCAAVVFFSDSYFSCPVSLYEIKTLLECKKNERSPKIFSILYGSLENLDIPRCFTHLVQSAVDLTKVHAKKSLAEKASVVVGCLMEDLEKLAQIHAPPLPYIPVDTDFSGAFKKKKICQWSVTDLQEWLFMLRIKEFYCQNLAENMVDGFLLMSVTDADMIHALGIDSRAVRKKIMQNIMQTLDKEYKDTDNWHLRARTQRPKSDYVYIIYDPADVRLTQSFKVDLRAKNLQVIHHDGSRLGKSKEDFLRINGSTMATASNVIIILTQSAMSSPFVFNEILFADWLGKKMVTAMFCSAWSNLRPALKAVLGDCPSIDFEHKMYRESLDVLVHHIKPLRTVPGVVLEQSYITKMTEGLKTLETLAQTSKGGKRGNLLDEDVPAVFISYHWDMQSKVETIKQALTSCGILSWSDVSMTSQRGHSSVSCHSNVHASETDTLQSQIQRNMKASAVVLCCITAKYLQSDNCLKDLTLAETLHKPIVPVTLRFSPLEGAPPQVRKIIARYHCHDLSNERMFKQSLQQVISRIRKIVYQTKP